MMRVARLNKNSDWTFGRGKAGYLKGSDAVGQNVVTRVRSFFNDWFLDTDRGIDWIGLLGTRGVRVEQIRRQVRNTTLETEGVLRIDSLIVDFDRAARNVRINLTITTVYGNSLALPEVQI